MKFIDETKIRVIGGDGGRGCISFRREKFVSRGGPNGGNGGAGGDVIAVADPQLTTLLDLRYHKECKAGRGQHGMGSDCHGRRGEDFIVKVVFWIFIDHYVMLFLMIIEISDFIVVIMIIFLMILISN